MVHGLSSSAACGIFPHQDRTRVYPRATREAPCLQTNPRSPSSFPSAPIFLLWGNGGGEAHPVLRVVTVDNPHFQFKFTSLPKFLAFAGLPELMLLEVLNSEGP